MADKPTPSELETIVAEMRRLGVQEYRCGDKHVVLGNLPVQMDEKSEEEQQRIRDLRERQVLERKRRTLLAASTRIGPKYEPVK